MYGLVDTHCDTISKAYEKGQNMFWNTLQLDMRRLLGYGAAVQFFAIWLDKKYHDHPFLETEKRIDFYNNQALLNKDVFCHANCYNDIIKNKESGRISGVLSIEGGEALEGNIDNIYKFYEKGVRAITLTWNYKNEIGCGAGVRHGALTEFGRQVIKEMEKLNMLVDVSHLNDNSFWEVARIAQKPFFASHSNSRRVTNVKRNLTDPQLKAIAQSGGIVGINLCPAFLTRNIDATIDDVLSHTSHLMHVIGSDHIGFGCDFDGIDQTPLGINGVEDMVKIIAAMDKRYGEATTAKIAEENFLRYFKQCL